MMFSICIFVARHDRQAISGVFSHVHVFNARDNDDGIGKKKTSYWVSLLKYETLDISYWRRWCDDEVIIICPKTEIATTIICNAWQLTNEVNDTRLKNNWGPLATGLP